MDSPEQTFLNNCNSDNGRILYRCRWSKVDADRIVPQLTNLLKSSDRLIRDESLRALFTIGTPAESAAPFVAELTRNQNPITQKLAVLTFGQISFKKPKICVPPLTIALSVPFCCRDALRTLAFIGPQAISALEEVKKLFNNPDAKIRKAAYLTAASIAGTDPVVLESLRLAITDRSKIVRNAVSKCLQKIQ